MSGRTALAILLSLLLTPAAIADGDRKAFNPWWNREWKLFNQHKRAPHAQLDIIRSLGKRDETVLAGRKLIQLLQLRDNRQRIAALQTLSDKRFATQVNLLLTTYRKLHTPKPSVMVDVEMVHTLGAIGAVSAPVLRFLSKKLQRPEPILLRHTVKALETLGKPACVDPLLNFLYQVFPPRAARDAGAAASPHFDWQRYRDLKQPLLDALKSTTEKTYETLEEWRAWYNNHKDKR